MSARNHKKFYVYVHFKPDLTPFYVGKGTGKRATQFWGRSVYHQNVVKKYGKENIIIESVLCNSEGEAFFREIETIHRFRCQGFRLCNISNGGEGPSGSKHSEETLEKMRKAHASIQTWKGRSHRKESKEKMAKAASGRAVSEESKKKISAFHKGKQWCLGRTLSQEHKEKISEGCKGKHLGTNGRPLGYKNTESSKAKCSESLKGHPVSESTREKLSLAAKEQWRRKRECIA